VGPETLRLRFSPLATAFVALVLVAATIPFAGPLTQLYDVWNLRPEYSHGVLIPFITAFLLWREREWLSRAQFTGSWVGIGLICPGLLLWAAGVLSTIYTISQYGFLLVFYGLILSLTGWKVFKRLLTPLLILIFMIPLPASVGGSLSVQMQLVSSWIGVQLIRLLGISVFLQGNVIDLGSYQLQVAEACDGLRYVYPLMTLAFLVAYFFRAPLWKRILLFAASIPIAILMNSLRIGVIGVTVEYWGQEMAEGLLHDFEGWLVFMLSTLVLIGFAAVLTRVGPPKTALLDALRLDFGPACAPVGRRTTQIRAIPTTFFVSGVLAAAAAVVGFALPERHEIHPARAQFADFPMILGDWQGSPQQLEAVYIDALHFDDYILADYRRPGSVPVNFYVAYYNSERQGQAIHSPRSCLPGGGWEIRSFERRVLPDIDGNGRSLPVNRAVIELGTQRQIVYYWFVQRGRLVTNEFMVKWLIFWDALTRNRTDGALVRLTAPWPQGAEPDADLTQLARQVVPKLDGYIPN